MPVNPNEAPEGFVAVGVSSTDCAGCVGCTYSGSFSCVKSARQDKSNVIFVPRSDKPATANFPHDDMGTPV